MDIAGLAQFREKAIAFLNHAIESAQKANASLELLREGDSIELPRQRIYQYWRKHWPQSQYPSEQEWLLIRGEIETGSLVFVRVGQSEASSFWIRLMSLTPEPTPLNASFVGEHEPDNVRPNPLCPVHGKTPANAIWECVIYSTRTGA